VGLGTAHLSPPRLTLIVGICLVDISSTLPPASVAKVVRSHPKLAGCGNGGNRYCWKPIIRKGTDGEHNLIELH